MGEPERNRDSGLAGQSSAGPAAAFGIDETIGKIESLYETVTGRVPPPVDRPYAPIPAEKDPGQHVEQQLNRLVEILDKLDVGARPRAGWTPRMSVWEADEEILVCLDVPGVTRGDVRVTTRGNLVTVTGTRLAPRERKDHRLFVSEEPAGEFRRTLLVPGGWSAGEPRAELKDGVLEIKIPREGGGSRGTRSVDVN